MTADSEKDIQALKIIGQICADTLRKKYGWSPLPTADNTIGARFEHTIVVTQGDPLIPTL